MPINSLSPAFVKIEYASSYAPHVMTVPCVPVTAPTLLDPNWKFVLRGLALPVNVDSSVSAFIEAYRQLHHTSTVFTSFTLFTQTTPESTPTPVYAGTLAVSGALVSDQWRKAVQITQTWRADDFTIFKMVHLDAPSSGFDRRPASNWAANPSTSLHNYVTADVTWVASRGGGKPSQFLQASLTLNEKLRRAYLMT